LDENMRRARLVSDYKFENRSNGTKEMCYVMAGWKPQLWDMVFEHLMLFVPKDMDVCIISGGGAIERYFLKLQQEITGLISQIKRDIGRIQNIVISLHPQAEMIYKMDEDMLVTEGSFEAIKRTHDMASKRYDVGFAGPVIPINSYGYVRSLELANKIDDYEENFGPAKYIYAEQLLTSDIWINADVAEYMWRAIDIDVLNEKLQQNKDDYRVCPYYFNIGFIAFTREVWEDMDYFWVFDPKSIAIGTDEKQFHEYVWANNKVIAVSENSVVGHFSAGGTEERMTAFREKNPRIFELPSNYK